MKEDRWVKSLCGLCLYGCNIKVHVVDGTVVKIEGDPDSPITQGKLCPKGNSGIMRLYDPNRVKTPLKRTNPNKGEDQDPQWVEISWEEAFDIITEKLKKIKKEDPRKLLYSPGDFQKIFTWSWAVAFGSPNFFSAAGAYCGAAYHAVCGIVHGAFACINDPKYCNYWLQVGVGDGFDSHNTLTEAARLIADARIRGMKLVTVDPRLSTSAAKSDEWIPIRPATDRALIMGMLYVLIHELNLYDREFLKIQTNAPYLVGEDGYHARERESGKPLIWDPVDNKAKPFDDDTIKDFALEGVYKIEGKECKPGFQILKNILKDHTPEKMSEITSVPASTIRRIAKEYGEAARIGSKIVIDGKEYPLRPAAVCYYRGAQSHKYGLMDNLAFILINMVVGNVDVPGGHLGIGMDCRGLIINPGADGMVEPVPHIVHPPLPFKYPPDSVQLLEFMPIGFNSGPIALESLRNPQKYGINYKPEALIMGHCNPLWNMPASKEVIEVMKKLDFIVSLDILINESNIYADIILPDHTYLESYDLLDFNNIFYKGLSVRQPAIPPIHNTMEEVDILTEIADRVGFLSEWNDIVNLTLGLIQRPECMLEPNKKYSFEEILDRRARAYYGDDHGLEWFKNNGYNLSPMEMYQTYGNLRLPFYFEYIKRLSDEVKNNMEKHGIEWDMSGYTPLPVWKSGPLDKKSDEYDMYAISFKSNIINFADTVTVSWINEICDKDPNHQGILINRETAENKGIKDGDLIEVESVEDKIVGIARLTEGIHPEVVGISNFITRWKGHPNIKTNTPFNALLPSSSEYLDFSTGTYETDARVRIRKIG